jgi:hypothetical protein
MEPDNDFLDASLLACCKGELLKTQEAIASGRLTPADLEELELATGSGHPDIVAALFDASARVSASTVDFLGRTAAPERHSPLPSPWPGSQLEPF